MYIHPSKKDVARFRSRHDQPSKFECWNWTGALFQKTGYGQFYYCGHTVLAHRFAQLLKDPRFDQLDDVLHTCDNRKCVNPEHIYLGGHEQNMKDMVDRDRQAKGEDNGSSILSASDVAEIFSLSNKGYSQRAIGRMVRISQAEVWNILNKRNWKHLTSVGTISAT